MCETGAVLDGGIEQAQQCKRQDRPSSNRSKPCCWGCRSSILDRQRMGGLVWEGCYRAGSPLARSRTSSKRSKTSGWGCKSAIMTVACCRCTKLRMHLTMRNVVELSRPVEISSRNNVVFGPTTISPAAIIHLQSASVLMTSAHHGMNFQSLVQLDSIAGPGCRTSLLILAILAWSTADGKILDRTMARSSLKTAEEAKSILTQ